MEHCPHCQSAEIKKNGRRGGLSPQRFQCKGCKRTFMAHYTPKLEPITDTPCRKCGCTKTKVRNGFGRFACKTCRTTQNVSARAKLEKHEGKQTLLITSAINDSKANAGFLKSLRNYCEHNDAQLIVIPLRYRNPTSRAEAEKQEDDIAWDAKLTPYLYDGRMQVCKGLQLLADIKTQPTAQAPLTGLDGFTGTDCGIVGHPKVALESIATRGHELPKLMLTTGCCTEPVYSDTTAGKKGEFHHVLGAVVVEIDGDMFHLRHVLAEKNGSFIDLDAHYKPTEIVPAARPIGLVMGDIHAERADPQAIKATHEIIDALQPKRLILHDVLDFGSASHHNSYFDKFVRHHSKTSSVIRELRTTCKLIDSLHRKSMDTAIISSNHHDHLLKWLSDSRNGDDMENAELFHGLKAEILAHAAKHFSIPNAFELSAKKLLKHPVMWVGDKDGYQAGGIEFGFHGDKGSNGSRGSAKAFDRIGVKTVIGHSHSPKIVGGCYQTGTTSQLDMGYNKGASSWLHSHVICYANSKRSHIHIIGTSWHGRRNGKAKK